MGVPGEVVWTSCEIGGGGLEFIHYWEESVVVLCVMNGELLYASIVPSSPSATLNRCGQRAMYE